MTTHPNRQQIEIPFPSAGEDHSTADIDRSPETTVRGENVRSIKDAKFIGSSRPGMNRLCPVAVGLEGSRALATITSDQQHVEYVEAETPETRWSAQGPSGKSAYAVRVDDYGNSYTLDGGTHIVIRNSAGVEQKVIVLPVNETGAVCRALDIDSQARRIFVGVSEAGSQARAKLWCYQDHPIRGWEILWEIEPGAFIEKLRFIGATLIAGLNSTDTGRAYVTGYDNLSSPTPSVRFSSLAVAPITTLVVADSDGDIAVGSGYNSERGKDPRQVGTGQILDRVFADYWVNDITGWSTRKYGFLDAETLEGAEGDEVTSLTDTFGSNREIHSTGGVVHLTGRHPILSGTQPADGDTITFALPDGSVTETYRWKTTPAAAGDVARGASLLTALQNLDTALSTGGNGTTVYTGTEPSALVYVKNVSQSQATVRCNTQNEVVLITLAGSGNLTANGAATERALSEKDVTTTGGFLKKVGMAGRQCIYFDGKTSRMRTLDNPNKLLSAVEQHETIFPGYGNNLVLASSARFYVAFVLKVYPTFTKASVVAQAVEKSGGGTWVRRIVANRNSSDAYEQGKLGVVENDGGSVTTWDGDYQTGDTANFMLVEFVSDPTGTIEVFMNGTSVGSGTAVANDSKFATVFGQSSYAVEDERFAEFELHKVLTIHSSDSTPISQAERELYEGLFAWHYGAQSLLPLAHPYYSVPPPPPGGSTSDWYLARKVMSTAPIVTKYDAKTQRVAWMAASDTSTPSTIGGLGYGLAFLSTGNLVSIGPPVVMVGTGADTTSVRLIVDKGDDYSLNTNDGAWAVQLGAEQSETFTYDKLELAVDEFDNVFVPFFNEAWDSTSLQFWLFSSSGAQLLAPPSESGQMTYSIAIQKPKANFGTQDIHRAEAVVVAMRRESTSLLTANSTISDGTVVSFFGIVDGMSTSEHYTFVSSLTPAMGQVLIDATVNLTLANLKAAVNHDPADADVKYDYSLTTRAGLVNAADLVGRTLRFNQRRYDEDNGEVSASASIRALIFNPADPNLFESNSDTAKQLRLVTSTVTGEEGRATLQVGFVGTDVWRSNTSEARIVDSGDAIASADARYWHSVPFLRWVLSTDGLRAFAYDTKTDQIAEWATTKGTLPERFQIVEKFRGRTVVLGIAGRPYAIVGSRVGDAFDFDRAALITGLQSFDTSTALSGDVPDLINGFCPLGDDNALVICKDSLWRLTGDPAPGANGQFDRIPTNVGGAFGRAWAVLPSGAQVIWTSHGEPAQVNDSGDPEPIVGRRFRRTFQEIDTTTHFIRMAWDSRLDGLGIVAIPYGGVDASSRAFFVERSTGAVWEDVRTDAELEFTDLIEIAGRATFACADGVIRQFDELAEDDDGFPFISKVTIGPICYRDQRFELKLSRLQVLLDAQSGDCNVELWVSDDPSDKQTFVQKFVLRPGMSPILPARVKGAYVWLVLSSKQRWAYQMATALVEPGGVKRARVLR